MKPENVLTKYETFVKTKSADNIWNQEKKLYVLGILLTMDVLWGFFPPFVLILNDSITSSLISSSYTFNFCCYEAFTFISKYPVFPSKHSQFETHIICFQKIIFAKAMNAVERRKLEAGCITE